MTRIDVTRERFLQTVRKTVADHQMLNIGDSVLVGLSGGADSMALLLVLLALREEYQLTISCAHVNHGLRAETAKRDMDFTISKCADLSVPISVTEVDVGAYAREKGISLEAAGREVRYRFFREQNTDKIAVAHNKNDCAETLLMNLTKGNLPLGIPPKRENIIRPLLGVTKEEIYAFLEAMGQDFVTDETNFSNEYTRNRVRLEFIPYIEEKFNQNFTNTIYNTSDILWQEQDFLEERVADFLRENASRSNERISLSTTAVANAHSAIARKAVRRCYYQLAGDFGHISFEQIERLIGLCKSGQSGQKIELPGGLEGVLAGNNLVFSPRMEAVDFSYPLTLAKWVEVPEAGFEFCLGKLLSQEAEYCYPIYLTPEDNVVVRNRKDGDKIYYQNLKIHKKLSDFMSEHKIPLWERNRIPLVTVNDRVRVITGYFWESVPNEVENLYYILIKKTGKGNKCYGRNGTGC